MLSQTSMSIVDTGNKPEVLTQFITRWYENPFSVDIVCLGRLMIDEMMTDWCGSVHEDFVYVDSYQEGMPVSESTGVRFGFWPLGRRLLMYAGPCAPWRFCDCFSAPFVIRLTFILSVSLHLAKSTTFRLSDSFDLAVLACLATLIFDLPFCFFLFCSFLFARLFSFWNPAIAWSNKKQPIVALLSTEVEYRGAVVATCEAIWRKRLLKDLHVEVSNSTKIYCDNLNNIQHAKNLIFHAQTKAHWCALSFCPRPSPIRDQ